MTVINDPEVPATVGSPRVKARVLEQMAEALEDEVGGLYRRAAKRLSSIKKSERDRPKSIVSCSSLTGCEPSAIG